MLVWNKSLSRANTKPEHVYMAQWTLLILCFFVPLCAVSLSLLEGGANGIDDTATQFAEVRADLRDFGEVGKDFNNLMCFN